MQNPLYSVDDAQHSGEESLHLDNLEGFSRPLNGHVSSYSRVDEKSRNVRVTDGDPNEGEEHVRVRPSFRDFALSSTLHGLPIVADRRNSSLRRGLWLVVFIISMGLMTFLLYESVETYLEREVSTKVTLKYVNKVPLPAVTVCNFNQFLWKKISQTAAKRVVLALVQPDPTQQLQWKDIVASLPRSLRSECQQWHTTTGLEKCLSATNKLQGGRSKRSWHFPLPSLPVTLPSALPASLPASLPVSLPTSLRSTIARSTSTLGKTQSVKVNAATTDRSATQHINSTASDSRNWVLQGQNNSVAPLNMSELADEIAKVQLDTFYLENGHHISSMLKSCNFRGAPCTAKDFTHVFTPYGNCYTFNSNQTLEVGQPGVEHGLDITLDVEQEQYVPGDRDLPAGFRLQVHSADNVPSVDTLGFAVAPGTAAYVSTQLQKVKNLPQPYGDCAPDAKLNYFKTYTLTNCLLECLTVETIKACGCRAVYMPDDGADGRQATRYCNALEMTNCVATIRKEIQSDTAPCKCQPPCRYETYSHSLSTALFPSDNSLLRSYNNSNPQTLLQIVGDALSQELGVFNRRNLVHISIFFEEINYNEAEQIKLYDEIKLIGDIGGIAGVLVGASALTILEFGDFLGNLFIFFSRGFRASFVEKVTAYRNGRLKQSKSVEDGVAGQDNWVLTEKV